MFAICFLSGILAISRLHVVCVLYALGNWDKKVWHYVTVCLVKSWALATMVNACEYYDSLTWRQVGVPGQSNNTT